MSTPAGDALYARLTAAATVKIATYGSIVQVYRYASIRAADGSPRRSWTAVGAPIGVFIADVDTATALRLWGADTKVRSHGTAMVGNDVAAKDGLLVLNGPFAGQGFLVVDTLADPVSVLLALSTGPREGFVA